MKGIRCECCVIGGHPTFVLFNKLSHHRFLGGWRRLHNEELRNFYALPNIIRVIKSRRMGWVGHVSRMGEMGKAYKFFVGKPEGKTPLGRFRHIL
jgi:hypothetical protein